MNRHVMVECVIDVPRAGGNVKKWSAQVTGSASPQSPVKSSGSGHLFSRVSVGGDEVPNRPGWIGGIGMDDRVIDVADDPNMAIRLGYYNVPGEMDLVLP